MLTLSQLYHMLDQCVLFWGAYIMDVPTGCVFL